MSEHGIMKYFRPILDKKDPPEDKELVSPSYPIHLGRYQVALSFNAKSKVTK